MSQSAINLIDQTIYASNQIVAMCQAFVYQCS